MPSFSEFHDLLEELQILDAGQLALVKDSLSLQCGDTARLAGALAERQWLTPYQVEHLLHGNKPGLVLGPYLLLDKLGEGGMGQVFKARHQKLHRVVAIKLIRKDRLADPEMVQRFYREVRAIAQLQHPNIVRAYDADEIDGTHYFSMEYIEGIDLDKRVRKEGPLPIAQACEFIRQTALGLQHSYERGLIHRDLKPANLLVSGEWGVVSAAKETAANSPLTTKHSPVLKILDLGLAHIEKSSDESSTFTREGMLMGTPDFMSPEQSVNVRGVDIRSDLYSLGCTFYFLLTGRVPFPGGSMTEKLLKHQMDQPTPIEQFRPDVPDELAAIVYRLMEKKPAERYQTPAEVAASLAELIPRLPAVPRAIPVEAVRAGTPPAQRVWSAFQWSKAAPVVKRPSGRSTSVPILVAGGILLTLVVCVGLLAMRLLNFSGGSGKASVKGPAVAGPQAKIEPAAKDLPPGPVTDEWIKHVETLPAEEQAKAVFAKLRELNEGFNDPDTHNIFTPKDDKVVGLAFNQAVTDISPVRALKHLERLSCRTNPATLGAMPVIVSLTDVSALRGLPLTQLNLSGDRIDDLSPLADMPLVNLNLHGTLVRDLTPLKGMASLRELDLGYTPVADLTPLQGLKLTKLNLANTQVEDIKPLDGLPLTDIDLSDTDVRDLSPLPMDSLTQLQIRTCPIRDLAPLAKARKLASISMEGVPFESLTPLQALDRHWNVWLSFDPKLTPALKAMPNLKRINHCEIGEFWKIVDPDPEQDRWADRVAGLPADEQIKEVAKRLHELNPKSTAEPKFTQADGAIVEVEFAISDLTDLRFLRPLQKLEKLTYGAESTLEGLRGLELKSVKVAHYGINDVSPLAAMPLQSLHFASATGIRDVSALRSTATLRSFGQGFGVINRVAPLADMPLTSLTVESPRDLGALMNMKTLENIRLLYNEARHRDALKAMTWLKSINGRKPDEFWTDMAGRQAEFVRREMTRLNGPDTKVAPAFDNGAVVGLGIEVAGKCDLNPLRHLAELQALDVNGRGLVSLEPLRNLPLKNLSVVYAAPASLAPLHGKTLDRLSLGYMPGLNDLSSLKGVKVRNLSLIACDGLTDFAPLRDLGLETLFINSVAGFKDVTPLKGLPLRSLRIDSCPLEDLTALVNMPLKKLHLDRLPVKNIAPLESMNELRELVLNGINLADLNFLRKMPLEQLEIGFQPFRGDADVLRAIPTLKMINGKNTKHFLQEADAKMAAFQKWCAAVAANDAKAQIKLVADELARLNPGFDAATVLFTPDSKSGVITKLHLPYADAVSDLAPVRALPGLRKISIASPGSFKNPRLSDLWPLKGMSLESLEISISNITDLSPLRDMRSLKHLYLTDTPVTNLSPLRNLRLDKIELGSVPVADITPLKDMKLIHVVLRSTKVEDLSPLRGMALTFLSVPPTVRDLSPLKGMPLEFFEASGAGISDYSVLADMPLKHLNINFVDWRDSRLLRSIRTLTKAEQCVDVRTGQKFLNVDAKVFHAWADWEDAVRAAPVDKQGEMVKAKLIEVNANAAGVSIAAKTDPDKGVVTHAKLIGAAKDISPLRAWPALESLDAAGLASLNDIGPLQGLKLKRLKLYHTKVRDLSPLTGMPLEYLNIHVTEVSDLEPIRGMSSLKELELTGCPIVSLEPLRGSNLETLYAGQMPKLTSIAGLEKVPLKLLTVWASPVTSLEPIRDCPLEALSFGYGNGITDLSPLKQMKSLRRLHNTSAACVDIHPLEALSLEEVILPVGLRDLFALRGMPIKLLACKFKPWRDYDVLKSLTKLERISPDGPVDGAKFILSAAEFWLKVEKDRADLESWIAAVRLKTPEEQFQALHEELLRRNPKAKFAGECKITGVNSVELNLTSIVLEDISPIRAFDNISTLWLGRGQGAAKTERCNLSDLWPMRGLKIRRLYLHNTDVADLRPLQGMPLEWLRMTGNRITDRAPLRELPLVEIELDYVAERDAPILRQIRTLKTINGKPALEVLK